MYSLITHSVGFIMSVCFSFMGFVSIYLLRKRYCSTD